VIRERGERKVKRRAVPLFYSTAGFSLNLAVGVSRTRTRT